MVLDVCDERQQGFVKDSIVFCWCYVLSHFFRSVQQQQKSNDIVLFNLTFNILWV